jgi:hypothetical protein
MEQTGGSLKIPGDAQKAAPAAYFLLGCSLRIDESARTATKTMATLTKTPFGVPVRLQAIVPSAGQQDYPRRKPRLLKSSKK